jgi:hypothetical protein
MRCPGAGKPANPESGHAGLRSLRFDDELLAHVLIHTWMLNTGRTWPYDVPPHDLTEQELIDFWADDQ